MRTVTQDAHEPGLPGQAHGAAAVPLVPAVTALPHAMPAPLAASGLASDPPSHQAARDASGPSLIGIDMQALHALGAAAGAVAGAGSNPEQAASIARQVADMAQGLAALADRLVGQGVAAASDTAEADCIAFLESQFRIRRLRSRHLVGISLGEPAWDILLDLAVAQYWRRETSVTSLCIAADVPSTTALRWISGMTKEGLIVRRPCLRDGRRSFLAIAPGTYQAMLSLAADALRAADKVRIRYQRGVAA
jgi:hypothetical protein